MKITHVKLSFSNAYLIRGRKTVMVDTGMPGEQTNLLRAAANAGVKTSDIALILHTHGHVDHAGSTAALAKTLGVPTAVHRADENMMRTGTMRPLMALNAEGRLILPLVNRPFPPVAPDLFLDDAFDLSAYGIEGRILHTPGHTAGSISILLPDGAAIAGDVMMGGVMGGNLFGARPNYHYFVESCVNSYREINLAPLLHNNRDTTEHLNAVHESIRTLLAAGVKTFYVGHGGPLARADVEKRFSTIL